jgi:hypothetical protein
MSALNFSCLIDVGRWRPYQSMMAVQFGRSPLRLINMARLSSPQTNPTSILAVTTDAFTA